MHFLSPWVMTTATFYDVTQVWNENYATLSTLGQLNTIETRLTMNSDGEIAIWWW